MIIEAQVKIKGTDRAIWQVITDIANATSNISGIELIEVLEESKNGLVGLKWRETRTIFGKTATEEMWITDAVENEFYKTRAESHGSIYVTTMSISGNTGGHSLTMSLEIKPQTLMSKFISPLMGLIFKRAIPKMLLQDLNDIKAAVECQAGEKAG